MTREQPEEKHESYGMLQICRTHGGERHLFGSSIAHQDTVRLSVHPGSLIRDLNYDWYHASNKSLIEIEMSPAQFADAIMNVNDGNGTPVTIRSISELHRH